MIGAIKKIRTHGVSIVVGLFYLYLIFHGISGSQGVFKLARHDARIQTLQSQIVEIQSQRLGLERQAFQLRASHLSRDRLDERAREIVSVSHPKEIVILLDE